MAKSKNNREMRITSVFKAMASTQNHVHPWQWPSCKQQPKTLSFRAADDDDIKTVNSVFLDVQGEGVDTPESSFSTESDEAYPGDSVEVLVRRAILSEDRRLFFEPVDSKTSSILREGKERGTVGEDGIPFKESVSLVMVSENPYLDFRSSMEVMVESHRLKEWNSLEELLCWYLRVNGKTNHGVIIDAFIDLLISLSSSNVKDQNPTTTTTSPPPTTPKIFTYYSFYSPCPPPSSSSCSLKKEESNHEIKE